jgi:hypothetical protein
MYNSFIAGIVRIIVIGVLAAGVSCEALAADAIKITKIERTVFFPKVNAGEPLRQMARLGIQNQGTAFEAKVKITMSGTPAYEESLGKVGKGASIKTIHVPDIQQPAELTVELYRQDDAQPIGRKTVPWQPQRKWNIYSISYSHHDLGYGDYPHRLRTTIRHTNIERPLEYCRLTDSWDDDSKYRFVIETSEPVTSFLASHDQAAAEELARRIREGRIQIGAIHSTVNTEQLSHECLARLFYLTNRHARDLLGVPAGKTGQIDDVVGLTWPLAAFCAEADVPYFFHGHNGTGRCLLPAADDPVFYWRAPDGLNKILVRSTPYGGYGGDSVGDGSEAHIEQAIHKFAGPKWPYDVMLLQEGTDFQLATMDTASKIHNWNKRWAYPRLICATTDMFFDAIASKIQPDKIKSYAKDGNNYWADQDANDAWLLGQARRLGETLPTVEKFATIAQLIDGGGYPWTDIYQAYHRLLLYHEHTNAIDFVSPDRERMQQYETEQAEDREMVTEAGAFCDCARRNAFAKLVGQIATEAQKNLVVFNPLARTRTDVVRLPAVEWRKAFRLIDPANGQDVAHQRLPNGDVLFLAADVPATGLKSYSVVEVPGDEQKTSSLQTSATSEGPVLENDFYRVAFEAATGLIASIRDKRLDVELVDPASPYKFNEYLYEHYDSPDPKKSAKWHRVASAKIACYNGPLADIAVVEAAPVGVESLRQTIVLHRGLRRIDFTLDIVKSPSGRDCTTANTSSLGKESLYIALPFAVPQGRFHHELPGAVVEPIRDQFIGSCTAFYATRHFADVSNSKYGATISTLDASLVEYGRPRSCLIAGLYANEDKFEKVMEYPMNPRMYLYLANNMFDTNVRWDQRGPMRFEYSLTSHGGDWRLGKADAFGWEVHNPLLPEVVRGKHRGNYPATGVSFLGIDKPNVLCTTIKPAEANGSGIILRFVESQGLETAAVATLPWFGDIASACETDLVENDRRNTLDVQDGQKISFSIRPFGVKTIRVLFKPHNASMAIEKLAASPLSDKEIAISWHLADAKAENYISCYNVYRGTRPDFKPTLLSRIGQTTTTSHTDRPQLNYGGWINNRLESDTTYFYKIAAVDRWNNEGPISEPVKATTLASSERNMPPLQVECLRAILVSPLAPYHYVNLLFRTNCESDVVRYEVHRSTVPGFTPDDSNRIGAVEADSPIKGSTTYGHTPIKFKTRDFDHAMFQDNRVKPDAVYYYRVCAVNRFVRKGPYSAEVTMKTGPTKQ